MKRDEEALVILTIFSYQYPFMLLLSVAPAVTLFLPLFSLFLFLFLFFLPLSSLHTGGLYQLGGPRCAPQSSIEGLEDIEVGSLQTASQYIHQQPRTCIVEVPNYLFSQNAASIISLPLSLSL